MYILVHMYVYGNGRVSLFSSCGYLILYVLITFSAYIQSTDDDTSDEEEPFRVERTKKVKTLREVHIHVCTKCSSRNLNGVECLCIDDTSKYAWVLFWFCYRTTLRWEKQGSMGRQRSN